MNAWFTEAVQRSFMDPGVPIAVTATTCFMLEMLWPSTHCSYSSRRRGAAFRFINLSILFSAVALYQAAMAQSHIAPLLPINLAWLGRSPDPGERLLGWVGVPLFTAIVGDFFFYWLHRALHAVPCLWRFHSVHHSITELSAFNCTAHFIDALLNIPFVVLPSTILINISAGHTPLIVHYLLVMHGLFEHSATRISLGPLGAMIVDNRYHRLHHSREYGQTSCNFADFAPLWDMLFGTARFPRPGEWPDTGVAGMAEPARLDRFMLGPFCPAWPRLSPAATPAE